LLLQSFGSDLSSEKSILGFAGFIRGYVCKLDGSDGVVYVYRNLLRVTDYLSLFLPEKFFLILRAYYNTMLISE